MTAITFPNNPDTIPGVGGQYEAENGLIYVWDGEKWESLGTNNADPNNFVAVSGDNMTGDLTLGPDGDTKITLDATDGSALFAGGLINLQPDGYFLSERNNANGTLPAFKVTGKVGGTQQGRLDFACNGELKLLDDANEETVTIRADGGSATFKGDIYINDAANFADGNGGVLLWTDPRYSAGGAIYVYKNTDASLVGGFANDAISVYAREDGETNDVQMTKRVSIKADGGATFGIFDAGLNTNQNGVQIDGSVFISRDANSGQVFRVRTPTGQKVSIDASGSADFSGTVTAPGLFFNLEPDNDDNYTTTTEEYTEQEELTPYVPAVPATYDEYGNELTAAVPAVEATYQTVTKTQEIRTYNGPTLDVKAVIQELQQRVADRDAVIADFATRLAQLEADHATMMGNNNGGY